MPISFGSWQSYPWKNELSEQSQRVVIHYAELLSNDFTGDHDPITMLDRALILSGFAMRRMIEKRLVTDGLRSEKTLVRSFPTSDTGTFRAPYISQSGGSAFRNYNFDNAEMVRLTIGDVANEIIHAPQLMIVHDEDTIPTGLLIASDLRHKNRLLHFTIDEFTELVTRVLDDQIHDASDRLDVESGSVVAGRN